MGVNKIEVTAQTAYQEVLEAAEQATFVDGDPRASAVVFQLRGLYIEPDVRLRPTNPEDAVFQDILEATEAAVDLDRQDPRLIATLTSLVERAPAYLYSKRVTNVLMSL